MAAVFSFAFVATLLVMYGLDQSQPARPALQPPSRAEIIQVASLRRSVRPVYPYSVVPGGVHSADDVAQAMRRDPVVADHYADVRAEDLREERVERSRLMHASYRIGDKVFWTARKIAIRPGEKILTDGKTTIRERCGNLLTVEPLAPALMDEPAPPEFDVPVTPWTPGAGYTLESPPVFFDPPDPPNPPEPPSPPILRRDPPVPVPYSVDSVMTPVPEPSTWMLLSLGLIVVIARSLAVRRARQP